MDNSVYLLMYLSSAGEPEVDEYFLIEADLSTFGGEICTASHLFQFSLSKSYASSCHPWE
jgi:hypothetical protein